MKIVAVRYRKLVSGPGFENKAIEAEAVLEDGEAPEDALLGLTQWVHSQISGESCMDVATLRSEVNSLFRQRDQLRGAVNGAQTEVRKLKEEILELEVKREAAGGEPALPF